MKLRTALPASHPRTRIQRCLAWLCAMLAGVLVHTTVGAAALDAALDQQVRDLARAATRINVPGVNRVEFSVGQLDARLRLAPCERIEPYLLNGTRLWGKSRIGLRCTRGTTLWNVFLPITIKVYARALVAATALPAGTVLAASDFSQAEIDLAEEPSEVLFDGRGAAGRTLAQALQPGQAVRQAHLKARVWFSAGDTVQVMAVGSGFRIAGEGQALSNGIEGQTARVRTEGGKVLSGTPAGERRLEIEL